MKKIPMLTIADIASEMNRLIKADSKVFQDEFKAVSKMPELHSKEFIDKINASFAKTEKATKSDYANMSTPSRYKFIDHTEGLKVLMGAESCALIKMGAIHGMPLVAVVEMIANTSDAETSERIDRILNSKSVGGVNNGNMYASLFPVYHEYSGANVIQFDSGIMRELQITDISSSVPVRMIEAPYDNCYIQFGPIGDNSVLDDEYVVHNNESGAHRLEGALISFHNQRYETMSEVAIAHLSPNNESDIRSVDIMFIGTPKNGVQDDATNHITLAYDYNSDLPLSEVLIRAMDYYVGGQKNELHPEYIKMQRQDAADMVRNIDLLSRCLVYMNCAECRKTDVDETTDLVKQLSKMKSPKKKRRIEKQLAQAGKYVLISPAKPSLLNTFSDRETERQHKAHWRRGHIRMQRYGEGRAKTKMIHISPILVGSSRIGIAPDKPTYIVK